MSPRFSIVIPVYNAEPYLQECLDSVLGQTHPDFEVICIDDGSTDGSGSLLDEYALRDVRVHVIHQVNAGVAAARNRGLQEAVGEWVWFVDGDDVIAVEALEKVGKAIGGHRDAMSVAIGYTSNREAFDARNPIDCDRVVRYDGYGDESLGLFFCGVCGEVLNRVAINGLKFPPFKRNEDGLFMLEAYWRGSVHLKLAGTIYYYRERLGSATRIVPRALDVASTFESQWRMIEILCDQESRHSGISLPNSWKHLHNFCFYTYSGMYFRLSYQERKLLLDEWLRLQAAFVDRYPIGKGRWLRIWLVRIFKSAYLVPFFVLWSPNASVRRFS